MALETLVTATDLQHWADLQAARYKLPLLLRRLIHATVEDIERIGFPADEGVQLGGWDGVVSVEKGNAFVPSGNSVWELGVTSNIKSKADEDYEKRVKDPLGLDPTLTTYTFVTLRRWGGKDRWVRERRKEGVWRDVRAYDADDLQQWLELAPAVHVWLSTLTGKHVHSAEDITNVWTEWSEATTPVLSTELHTLGREEIVGRVYEWLRETPSVLSLKADTRREAVAFFAAALQQLPPDQQLPFLSRTVIAGDIATWNHLCTSQPTLILVPMFEVGDAVVRASRVGHHVLLPLGRDDSASAGTLELPRQHVATTSEALRGMGLPEERLTQLAPLARRSLMALRRTLARNPEAQPISWARPDAARAILPALLAGKWRETVDGDRNVLASLANTTYEQVSADLSRWANESDPPVRRTGDTWMLVSQEDAWSLLSRYLTRTDMERFEAVVLEVLGEMNPALELEPKHRAMAQVLGKKLTHSGTLREGLASSLALLGARGEAMQIGDSMSSQDRANRIVHRLLDRANTDWHIWASAAYQLPLIAEAAPREYLRQVEAGLSGKEPILANLFQDSTGDLFSPSSPHTGLLWSLEGLAWNPEYLSRAALCLATLGRIDPGGKLANRPGRSLRIIFQFWHPGTSAPIEKRLEVLDLLREREPTVAWGLMRDLLPKRHGRLETAHKPRWREWVPEQQPVVPSVDFWSAEKELVKRMLADVGADGHRWKDLIEHLDDVQGEPREAIVTQLLAMDASAFSAADRLTMWASLRELISRHRKYPNSDWAMPSEVVDRFVEVYQHLEPDNLVDKYSWLFTLTPRFIDVVDHDWEVRSRAIVQRREESLKALYEEGGLALLVEFSQRVAEPHELGRLLGQGDLLSTEEDALLGEHLSLDLTATALLAHGFVFGRFLVQGWDWVENKVVNLATLMPDPEKQAAFFINLPFEARTWDLLEATTPVVGQLYWSRIRARSIAADDWSRAARNLLDHRRPHAVLDLASLYVKEAEVELPTELLVEALDQVIKTPAETNDDWQTLYYHMGDFLDYLQASGDVDPGTIASLELALLPLLEHSERGPKVLHESLASSPALFLEALRLAYRSEGQEEQELNELEKTYARLAFDLLSTWHRVPGTQDDGSIDPESLSDWIRQVREGAQTSGHREVADDVIGQVLCFAPEDADGSWPSRAVRDVIELVGTEQLHWGFVVGVLNRRGMVSRGLIEGGAQERELVARYQRYAEMIRDRWPRTATALDDIAEDYASQAHRADISAELEEDMWH
ncbi:MAG: hypothetical protein M3437_01780 [Chloroflexota bacterium]|nr:hypothetical protein [Chloroflexota bacterium]MDQ5865175.1 hypothetical protein [Chloroflexota bacterium]